MEACEPGGGGALCLILSDVSSRVPVSIEITDTNFIENEALVGGAIAVSTGVGVNWRSVCSEDNSAASLLLAYPCRHMSFRRVLFERNKAKFVGGGLLTTHFPHLHLTNDDSLNFKTINELDLKEFFKNNTVNKDGYGPDVAGAAVRLNIITPKQNETSNV